MRDGLNFLSLNLGYFFDHFFILIIATVVLALGYTGICAIFPIIVALLHESSSR